MSIRGKFNVDVFDCTVHIVITKSIRSSINYYLKKYGQEIITYEPSGLFCNPHPERIGNYFILYNESDITIDIVNHEKSHLVEHILVDRDIEPIDEIRSYLDGYISRKVDEFLKRKGIKVSNKRPNKLPAH